MTCKIVSLILPLSICLLPSAPAWAQKNIRNQQDEKRENQRVADAQKQVRVHQNDVNEAEQKLRSVMRSSGGLEAKLAHVRGELRETRERAADRLAKSMGIDAALAHLKDVRAQLATFSQPVLEKLHQSSAWIEAKKAADEAKQQADAVREDVQLSDEERTAKIKELTPQIVKPNELDRQTILDMPEGKRLTDEVTAALAAIEKIRKAIPDEKVDADPTVIQVKKSIEKAEQELKKHAQSVLTEREGVQKAQQRLVQSRQKLQQAQAADARDRNRK